MSCHLPVVRRHLPRIVLVADSLAGLDACTTPSSAGGGPQRLLPTPAAATQEDCQGHTRRFFYAGRRRRHYDDKQRGVLQSRHACPLASSAQLSGLAAGEMLLGIDTRPADGLVYAVGSNRRIYMLNPATGALTAKSTLGPAAGDDNPFTALPAGANYGVDFNPAADRLRPPAVAA